MPGDCSYRPEPGTDEHRRIQARRAELAKGEPEPLAAVIERAQAAMQATRAEKAAERGMTLDEYDREQTERTARRIAQSRIAGRRAERLRIIRPYAERISTDMVEAIADESLERTVPVLAIEEWAKPTTPQPILYLAGAPGTGKTVAVIAELVRCARDCAYVPASDLARRYDRWASDLSNGVPSLDLGVELLALDDLGSERGDDPRFIEALTQTIDRRTGPRISRAGAIERRRTIIASNVLPRDVRACFGVRIADRLLEHAVSVTLTSSSMRRKGTTLTLPGVE